MKKFSCQTSSRSLNDAMVLSKEAHEELASTFTTVTGAKPRKPANEPDVRSRVYRVIDVPIGVMSVFPATSKDRIETAESNGSATTSFVELRSLVKLTRRGEVLVACQPSPCR